MKRGRRGVGRGRRWMWAHDCLEIREGDGDGDGDGDGCMIIGECGMERHM